MMKKLVFGMAVFGGVTVNGMDNPLVDAVVESPMDRSRLTALVSDVISSNDKTLKARSCLSAKITPQNEDIIYRICSMLYQLSRDIRFNEVNSLNYYVYGALQGNFGPYMD